GSGVSNGGTEMIQLSHIRERQRYWAQDNLRRRFLEK
uniref:Egg-laying-like hormone n=1 Tax=Theromyzon tessulatum TaxID=13286 RepID=ELH_THETS|nr:RecName: Full=Egg-laying-like hormone; AltName: Full=L-ELH [Theromyzon tessulatum]